MTDVDQQSSETELSIAICRPSGDKWKSKTLFLAIFDPRSSIVKSFFDCHLSDVSSKDQEHKEQRLALDEEIKSTKRLDFLDILLTAQDDTGRGLTDLEIRSEVDTFLFAGKSKSKLYFNNRHTINPLKPNEIYPYYQLDLSISVLRVVEWYFQFYSIFDRTFCKQTVDTLVRRHVLWRLICVCTVCLCHTKRTLDLYGLNT